MYSTKEELLINVLRSIPYSSQISSINLDLEGQIRFTWRSDTFRVSLNGMVEQVEGGMLTGSNTSILLEALLKAHKND